MPARAWVFLQILDELLGLSGFATLGGGLLGGNFAQVAFEGYFQRHALGAVALDGDITRHIVFGTPRPVLRIALGGEGFGYGWPAGFANRGFLSVGRGFD